ncbi:MAG TPA: oxygen-independent coproporphyrinogen III oxidase [Hyphomicrobiaceae bacterium]|nr:oxygen-independent coproporphyrinogen III oxidase [Hyphomicrobiaceae bacterium]
MQTELIARHSAPVPRYTSYPTAPHFVPTIAAEDYACWLRELPADTATSLYVHIPFCEKLCWYCGCNTKATEKYEPVAKYLDALAAERATISGMIGNVARITHMHWGGGSPSILSADDILKLTDGLRRQFRFDAAAEVAVEVDPRTITLDKIKAFVSGGFNRVSVGVQDFSDTVQEAINRLQGFDTTRDAIDGFRSAGIGSVNIDLVYGLPRQTLARLEETVSKVITLAPDRIALFGYAHLPARIVHQRMIADADLPNSVERFAQANRAANMLTDAGYIRIGLDHFARPDDSLATGTIRRNFQGYTTDTAETLIGLGASSIGRLEQGYVQNATAVGEYARRVLSGGLATVKGRAFTDEDRARGHVIEDLLCNLRFSAPEMIARYGAAGRRLAEDARRVVASDRDGLVAAVSDDGSFEVTEKGRHFLRSICACFDAYLGQGTATHATGV